MLIPVEIPSLGRQARRLETGGQHEKYQDLKHMNIFVWLSEYLTWNYSLFCMLLRKKQNQVHPPHTHTHICTPLLYYLAWFSRNFSECIFLLIPHCSAMGFGLCLSLNWNIWEEKYTLKIECCLVSRSGQLFAESYVFSGSLVVDRWWVCLCCLVSLGLDFHPEA